MKTLATDLRENLDGHDNSLFKEDAEFEEAVASQIFSNQTIKWEQELPREGEPSKLTQNPEPFETEGDERTQEEFIPFDEGSPYPQDAIDAIFYHASDDSMYLSTQTGITFAQPGSLLDLYNQSAQIISPEEEKPSPGHKARSKQLSRRKSKRHQPYLSPSSSERSDDEGDSDNAEFHATNNSSDCSPTPRPKRRNGHTPGINRQTGELTLIGRYPPMQLDLPRQFGCRHCWAPDGERNSFRWTTRNGYKYHLTNVCPGNPDSVKSIKLRRAKELGTKVDTVPKKPVFSKVCECGVYFRSENGYRMHRMQNETTKNGRCMQRGSKNNRVNAAQKIEAQRATFDVNTGSQAWNGAMTLEMVQMIAPYLAENNRGIYQGSGINGIPDVNENADTPDVNFGGNA